MYLKVDILGMGLLSKIRGGKGSKVVQGENVLDMVKETPTDVDKTRSEQKTKEDTGRAFRILKNAHLSEKTTAFGQNGRYVFKVSQSANKLGIRQAVEKTYDVHVVKVNIINSKGKPRRTGRTTSQTGDWKKAVVTLKTGEKISGLIEGV